MENRFDYDFSNLFQALEGISANYVATPDQLVTIKKELNRFFKDSNCKEVLYTTNTDKMFFGIKIVPIIDVDSIFEYLIDDEDIRIDSYIVEFDSKLFDPIMNLSAVELAAVLVHEVSRLVGDSTPMMNARNAMNRYLAANRDHIKITQSVHYKEILAYGLKDYLSKCGSLFYIDDKTEIYADEFAAAYGFSNPLSDAYDKIHNANMKLYENSEVSKFITFAYALTIYKNLRVHRVGSIHVMTRAKLLTGSRLERMEMENVIRRVKRIDDESILEGAMTDTLRLKLKEKMKKNRLNNMRTLDNAFYELNLQLRNVDTEEDALYLMRQINTNISIIEEYMNSVDCDEWEKDRWSDCLKKFTELREKLSNNVIYKNKTYGIFVAYPEIVENRY